MRDSGQLHCWLCKPAQLDKALIDACHELLSTDEKARVQRFRHADQRLNSLVARALLRDRLALFCEQPANALCIATGEKGKPYLPDFPDVQFNLSHTGNLVALVATHQHPVGIDVEWLSRRSDALGIAHRFFSPSETAALFALPKERQRDRFFDYWTLKESYIKACGLGLAIPLRQFSFILGDEPDQTCRQHIDMQFAAERGDHPANWQNWLIRLDKAYRLAISLNAPKTVKRNLTIQEGAPLAGFRACALS